MSVAIGSDAEPTDLLERADCFAVLGRAVDDLAAGRGRLILIGGEAGVGKTAVLERFRAGRPQAQLLWGACERLFTPRALGPFVDIAEAIGGDFERAVTAGATADALLAPLRAALERGRRSVIVVEDAHWADEGTLDLIKMLARSLDELAVLVIVSYRDDQLRPTDSLQIVLGELAGARGVERIHLAPLSPEAVTALAEPHGIDGARLFERTAGNPFYVTEVLAGEEGEIPASVRDAVLARAAHLGSPARRLLEAASVVPARIELWLLEELVRDEMQYLGECLSSGMLRFERASVAFRHELARIAIEEAIVPHERMALHRRVLSALSHTASGTVDPARLSHHAEAAGDAQGVLQHAPLAAARAASVGAHLQAAEQYHRALRHAEALPLAQRAELYDRLAYEQHLGNDDLEDALQAAQAALSIRRTLGQRVEEGVTLAFVARVLWFLGRAGDAEAAAQEAVRVLEALDPGPQLAMAYADVARLVGLAHRTDEALSWAVRAIEVAERFGAKDALFSALNTLGTTQLRMGYDEGWRSLERSLELAQAAGHDDDVTRALVNLAGMALELRQYPRARDFLNRGLEYTAERELSAHRTFMFATRARWHLDQGNWDAALADADHALRPPQSMPLMRVAAMTIVGLIRARRGEPAAWPALDEALGLVVDEELQQIAPLAAARAEAAWLEQDQQRLRSSTEAAFALALERRSAQFVGELAYWRFKGGLIDQIPDWAAEPHASQIRGDWSSAAREWERLGCPYEAALALGESGEKEPLRRALLAFNRLGAVPAARVVAAQLRELGVRRIDRGPRRSTLASPALLTTRQQEILALLGDRLTNAEIAARLFISTKTVDHHVSAILGKLGVHSRHEAAAEAARLGLLER